MRTLGVVLFALIALVVSAQPPVSSPVISSDKLSIPAELIKTVRADKAHAGDPVKFRTLEAVLVSKDLVMPANALLHGRVLSAHPKQEGKNSWLALVVDRAEWKQHSVPLHAFVAAQITVSVKNDQPSYPAMVQNTPGSLRRGAPPNLRGSVQPSPALSSVLSASQDARENSQAAPAPKYPKLENVGLVRGKDGTTYLLSSKASVKLPGGLWLMLQNEPPGSSEAPVAQTTPLAAAQP